jgi:speckle-type POZ protein
MEECREAFGRMLASEEGADCSIVVSHYQVDCIHDSGQWGDFQVGGKTFKAHRAILCARSPVFSAMFQAGSGFDEAVKGHLLIPDSTPKAIRAMLQYIYTGRVEWPSNEKSLTSLQEAVLILADKYELLSLKGHVEGLLAEGIDGGSFFHLVYLADDYQCEGLKQVCASYFAGNRAAIAQRAEWGHLKKIRAAVAAVLLEAAALPTAEE